VERGLGGAVLSAGSGTGPKGSRTGGPSPRAARTAFQREFPGGSESANACVVSLARTGEAVLAAIDTALRHHRLSRAGREALAVLEGAGRPLSPTDIAAQLIVTTASVTSLLDTLERRGLVERRPDPADRRRVLVVITAEGRALVDRFLPEVVALQTAALAGLSESQREQLLELLATVRAGLADLSHDDVVRSARPRRRPGGR
jgi:DNA-binding MarR family transcriptional regulator